MLHCRQALGSQTGGLNLRPRCGRVGVEAVILQGMFLKHSLGAQHHVGEFFFFLMGKLVKALAVFPEPAKFKEDKGWGIESPSPIRHLVVLPGQWNIVE